MISNKNNKNNMITVRKFYLKYYFGYLSIFKYYLKYFSKSERAWNFFLKELSRDYGTSLTTLQEWEKVSKLEFSNERYTELLQISFLKNWHNLSEYLLDNKTFTYPFTKSPDPEKFSKTHFLDGFMTDNLLQKDHAAWLALMACHHPLHLLKLEKNYDFEEYYYIARKFFLHASFKSLYTNKERRELIISRCPTNATKMLVNIFLEMDLSLSKKSHKVIKI